MTDWFILLLDLFNAIKPNYRIKIELWSEFCYTKTKHGTVKAQCDLILYFRLGRVGKKWEEMGRCWMKWDGFGFFKCSGSKALSSG